MQKKKNKLFRTITFTFLLAYPFLSVFSKSILSKINYEVEETKEKIALQKKNNDSLEMQINELASLKNLEAIAKNKGLSYSYNSVKTIK